jgi:hypothetical protein
MFAVPLVSVLMAAVAGGALTAQTDPMMYIRGFQVACMVVGCIGMIAVACAFVPERATRGPAKDIAAAGLAAQRR